MTIEELMTYVTGEMVWFNTYLIILTIAFVICVGIFIYKTYMLSKQIEELETRIYRLRLIKNKSIKHGKEE